MDGEEFNEHTIYSALNYQATEDANKVINTLNGLLVAFFFVVFDLKGIIFTPLNIGFHYYMRWLAMKDPFRRDAYINYLNQSDHYDPWITDELEMYGDRPYGLGKGIRH